MKLVRQKLRYEKFVDDRRKIKGNDENEANVNYTRRNRIEGLDGPGNENLDERLETRMSDWLLENEELNE